VNERVPTTRLAALDLARGLAVLGMVWLHLVATEGGDDALERAAATFGAWIYGKPAALFCVLAGVSWAIQTERGGSSPGANLRLLRRALALAAMGVVFGRTVWPTEILTPMACMMPLGVLAWRGGTAVLCTVLLAVLGAMPLGQAWFGDFAWSDWNADGTVHGAENAFGWITLRYYLYTGNYPLIGWLAFPLVGCLAVRLGVLRRDRARRHAAVLLPSAALVIAANAWLARAAAEDGLGELTPHLTATWVPTSIPFVLAGALLSWGVIAAAVALDARWHALAALGRASLSHYVLHVLVVFVPLRACWPAEDWSITVGIAAFAGYLAVALPATWWWFGRHRRGPIEAAWAAAAAVHRRCPPAGLPMR
jgi:uncharacterized membrane protein YeiB